MTIEPRGYEYPAQSVRVVPFPEILATLFTQPTGLSGAPWPPTQIDYIGFYLKRLECKTVLVEGHYVDRDFVDDHALFYARSLRGYPNHCQRLHFFRKAFDAVAWKSMLNDAHHGQREQVRATLQEAYLGFSVIKPLPGSLVGRTVLCTWGDTTPQGEHRDFGCTRPYSVHLAGLDLQVRGLAFQQQDQGVSACATTALWSAIHRVAPLEGLALPTPAQITQAASRYFLPGGRALPSEGLTIDQICEATRSSGLAPVVVRGLALDQVRAHLHGYLSSGFPAVLALHPLNSRSDGHAVCAVGLKTGSVQPQTNPELHFRDVATSVMSVYIHDDRLGPYAVADLSQYTLTADDYVPGLKPGDIIPALRIRWPGGPVEFETSMLWAMVAPIPVKVRLTIARMRSLGIVLADTLGTLLPSLNQRVDMSCRYQQGSDYLQTTFGSGLSDEGLYELLTSTVLSRYVAKIQLVGPQGHLIDVLLDATETEANPSVLCCVGREALPPELRPAIESIARRLGAVAIF